MADKPKEGWLGKPCPCCNGTGQRYDPAWDNDRACAGCGGTGEAYGPIEPQPDSGDREDEPCR